MANTKTKTTVTKKEKEILRVYVKTSPLILVRMKAQAVLMRSHGMTFVAIGDIVTRSDRTVQCWLADWKRRRMASIFTGHNGNENAGKLTKEQKEEIKKALASPPSAYGIPKTFWDVPALKEYTKTKFSVVYESAQSYHVLLSFSNLSFKYPDTFDHRRDDDLITERMEEIHKEIAPLLRNPSWEVFASDEVRMELEAFTRKAWLKRGERTIVQVNRKREAQSYLGLLNQKNFQCHLYELDWQNQEEILKGLEQFLNVYPNKKICIVWDNARFHKGKEIRNALGKGKLLERVHLINLPPYAPDHNPIEHVWNTAKGKMANIQYEDFTAMKNVFRKSIDGKIFSYAL